MTEAEVKLWQHIRCKQIRGVQFYRQKSLVAISLISTVMRPDWS